MPEQTSRENERSVPNLAEILSGRKVREVTQYGSSLELGDAPDHDLDLLIVLDEDVEYERRVVGRLDLGFQGRFPPSLQ